MQDFRIDTFLSVCETLNYTKTAEFLHITQPAVSQHIRFLEALYGTKLLTYRNRKLRLTDQGLMLRDASRALRSDDDALRRKMAASHQCRERLLLGLTMTVGECMAARSVARFLESHDELQVSIHVADTSMLLHDLDQGTIDCAIIEGFCDKTRYGYRTVSSEPFIGVCAPGNAESKNPKRFDELLARHLITREQGSGTRAVLEHALADQNLQVRDFARITETNSIALIKGLVEETDGIAFLYQSAIEADVLDHRLERIFLTCDPLVHDITGVWRKGSCFAEYYRDVVSEIASFMNCTDPLGECKPTQARS
jgi:DNA-binding transcriptional LysR family regulator